MRSKIAPERLDHVLEWMRLEPGPLGHHDRDSPKCSSNVFTEHFATTSSPSLPTPRHVSTPNGSSISHTPLQHLPVPLPTTHPPTPENLPQHQQHPPAPSPNLTASQTRTSCAVAKILRLQLARLGRRSRRQDRGDRVPERVRDHGDDLLCQSCVGVFFAGGGGGKGFGGEVGVEFELGALGLVYL